MSAESQEVRELAADLPTAPEHEPIAHLAAVAENTDRGEQDALIRTPAGRLVPSIPLDEPIGVGTRPFRRPEAAEPSPRWVGAFLAVCAVLFVPYILALTFTVPVRDRAAWVGLDVMELLAIALTAWFAWSRSTWVVISSSVAATLVVTDAWFDIVTSHSGMRRVLAIVEAVVLELPFAAFCLWIARHAEVVADRATRLLLRRSAGQAERLRQLER